MQGHPFMGNLGGVRTFEPIPNNPAEGGSGYFRRSVDGGRVVRTSSARRRVNYATLPAVPDTEPGGNPSIAPRGMMFQQDGKLVPIPPGFLDGAPGEAAPLWKFLLFGTFGGALVGTLFGVVLSSDRRVRNGAIGAGLGAATGALASFLISRGASLAK